MDSSYKHGKKLSLENSPPELSAHSRVGLKYSRHFRASEVAKEATTKLGPATSHHPSVHGGASSVGGDPLDSSTKKQFVVVKSPAHSTVGWDSGSVGRRAGPHRIQVAHLYLKTAAFAPSNTNSHVDGEQR